MIKKNEYFYRFDIFKIFSIIYILPLLIVVIIGILKARSIIFYCMFIPFSIIFVVTLFLIQDKFKEPLVIIQENLITIKSLNWWERKYYLKWEDIEGFEIEYFNIYSKLYKSYGGQLIKIILKDKYKDRYKKPIIINTWVLENPQGLINDLKNKIPDMTELKRKELLNYSPLPEKLKYNKYDLSVKGISIINKFFIISWNDILEIKTRGKIIKDIAYKGIVIKYRDMNGNINNLKISPKTQKEYPIFIKYIIKNSSNAVIDPLVYNNLKISPEEARAETGIFILIIFSLLLLFSLFAADLLERYVFNISYLIIFITVSVIWLITLCFLNYKKISRINSNDYSGVLKEYKIVKYCSFLTILSFIVFFLISPGSGILLKGDLYLSIGNMDMALEKYTSVLEIYPENINIIYNTAVVHYQLEEYEESYQLMIKAYELFQGRWNPEALELICDSLIALERYDEAFNWCEKIIGDYSTDNSSSDLIRLMKKKRTFIKEKFKLN